jgi:hypothetical protein
MQELSVFIFFDCSLGFVESLLDENAILDIKNTICIAFKLWIVSNHYTSCGMCLAFTSWSDSIDVQN